RPAGGEPGLETPAASVRARSGSLPRDPLGTEAASIVFTSGSTGCPKGATQSHGSLFRGCLTVGGYLGLGADDRILCAIPWSFDYGYIQLQTTAAFGCAHILPTKPTPFAICDAIEEHRPTVLPGTPALFSYLLQNISPFRKTDLSSVRV